MLNCMLFSDMKVEKECLGRYTLFPVLEKALRRVYWGPPCFQGDIIHNERRLPALGAFLVYNFLLVATILPKYVSGCWTRVMMSYTCGKAALLGQITCFLILKWNQEMHWDSALTTDSFKTTHISTSHPTAILNELIIIIFGFRSIVMLDNAANIFLQPLTNQRGGHCLFHTEITFPYQLSVEIQCLMFVCCRKVVAVNQVGSESFNLSINLFALIMAFWQQEALCGPECRIHVAMRYFCTSSETKREGETAASILAGSNTTESDSSGVFNAQLHPPMLSVMWSSSVQAEHSQLDSERMLLILRTHNKTRQIKERLRDTSCSTEAHSLKVMHCKIAFLLGGTFILRDGCRLTVSANRPRLCV